MTLPQRHMPRRVAAVGVATALLVLSLETPAFAAAPTITAFLPLTGPVGCVVTITGTNFNNPNVTDVEFNNVDAASFSVDSGTSITAVVGTGTSGSGPVEVTNADGTASFGAFTVAPSLCPTITSFTPTSGPVGTSVTITGTNFIAVSSVTFNNVAATFSVDSATQITATVPTTATTGPIRVTTLGGTGSSLTNFTVAAPSTLHSRGVTLSLKRHLVARGAVSVEDDTAECTAGVPVKIQRRKSGSWRTVGSATTNDAGTYKRRIKDRPGKYRALAPAVTLEDDSVCAKARSPGVRHRR